MLESSIFSTLAGCLERWEIFSTRLNTNQQNELLDRIIYETPQKRALLEGSASDEWVSLCEWDARIWSAFSNHLKWTRRFLPKSSDFEYLQNPADWLPELLETTDFHVGPETVFFRTRLGSISNPFGPPSPYPREQMGAPPPQSARGNRANPAGIPYLYLAEEEETAVAEIRPFVGAQISICKFRPRKPLKVADLTKIHRVTNPFAADDLRSLMQRNALLNILNVQLARPINPNDSDIEYVPTQ